MEVLALLISKKEETNTYNVYSCDRKLRLSIPLKNMIGTKAVIRRFQSYLIKKPKILSTNDTF